MEFIDTHSHLYDEAFAGEEDAAVNRAVESGVGRIIFPDIDSGSREAMFSFADRFPGVYSRVSACIPHLWEPTGRRNFPGWSPACPGRYGQ